MKVLHTRGREAGGRATRKATAFHGSVSAAITNTEHTPDTVTGGSAAAPFLRGERRRGGAHFLCSLPREMRLHCGGGREQKSARTNSLYCNLFYSTFP